MQYWLDSTEQGDETRQSAAPGLQNAALSRTLVNSVFLLLVALAVAEHVIKFHDIQ